MGKIPEGGTSNFSFIIEIKWSEIFTEVWLPSRLHEHIPTKRDSRKRNWLESAKRSRGYVIVPSGGCTLICTQILTPHEHERLDLQITPFLRSGKIIERTHPPLPRLGVRSKTWKFSGSCIGFNPFGGFVKGDHLAPNSWRESQLFERCVGDAFGDELHRELQHLAVPLFFFWGDTQRVCGFFGL